MENRNNNSKLKTVILILSLLLVTSLAYMFKMSTDATDVKTELTKETAEKETVLSELAQLKTTYDAAIAENTSLSDELITERDKVIKLMEDVKKSNGSISSFKKQMASLQEKMNTLVRENDALTKMNQALTTTVDSAKTVIVEAKEYNQVLVGQNDELSKTIEKGSILTVLNLKMTAYKVRNSGKEIETEVAKRADVLRIGFTVAENKIAKSGDRTYYIQVIDASNNVLGDKKTIEFGEKHLSYSFITTIKYENSTVNISENLKGSAFVAGTYFVNIFDKGTLVSKTSFLLK